MKEKFRDNNEIKKEVYFFIAELILIFLISLIASFLYSEKINAEVGENATVTTNLEVGKSAPEILSINIEGGSVTLTANSTKTVNCSVIVRDYDTDIDIINVTAEFFDTSVSSYGDSDDNNYHYTNNSCFINTTYGNENQSKIICKFNIWYYANSGNWRCRVEVEDNLSIGSSGFDDSFVNVLLAVGLVNALDYGIIDMGKVSNESILNITNYGNVKINLSLSGYAIYEGDGLAMNCTLGSIKNISIDYEKYNLTASNPGVLTLAQFESLYTNLTSNVVVKEFNLDYRHNDTYNEAINETYWRIYVPTGVAGTCQGKIVFGATQAAGS